MRASGNMEREGDAGWESGKQKVMSRQEESGNSQILKARAGSEMALSKEKTFGQDRGKLHGRKDRPRSLH